MMRGTSARERARLASAALQWPRPTTPLLGAITLATLAALGLLGVAMALRYDPRTFAAHEASAAMGLLGDLHAWLASALLVLVLVHPVRAFLRGRTPARPWLTGVAALAVLTVAFFTGTVLPWDQQGWEALQHVEDAAGTLGASLFDPEAPDGAPLTVVFYAHVLGPPALLAALLAVHLHRRGSPLRARLVAHLRRAAPVVAVLVALVLVLAIALPSDHGPAPIEGVAVAKPDWPFLWLVPIQDALGPAGLWALPLAGAALAALPWLSRGQAPSTRRRVVVAAAIVLVALSILGAVS